MNAKLPRNSLKYSMVVSAFKKPFFVLESQLLV